MTQDTKEESPRRRADRRTNYPRARQRSPADKARNKLQKLANSLRPRKTGYTQQTSDSDRDSDLDELLQNAATISGTRSSLVKSTELAEVVKMAEPAEEDASKPAKVIARPSISSTSAANRIMANSHIMKTMLSYLRQDRTTLARLMRTNGYMYILVGPMLYDTVAIA